jgi:Xaa-Pro aminopeptidase
MQDHQRHLRSSLAAQRLDGAILVSPAAICHATGVEIFLPLDAGSELAIAPAVALLSADDTPAILLVSESHARRALEQVDGAEVVAVPSFGHFDPVDAGAALVDAGRAAWEKLGGPLRLGVEPRWLPYGLVDLVGLPLKEVEIVDAAATFERARAVKSGWEVERIRRAVSAADAAQAVLTAGDLVGRNELGLWGEILAACARVAGREVTVFADLVTGPRTGSLTYPGGPVDREVEAGDSVILDVSVRVDGYWADCTSTIVAGGDPSAEQLRHYRASRAAFDAAIDCLRPGRRAYEAEAAARAAFAGEQLARTHYAGHQIGCAVNEPPRLVPYDDSAIQPGMVFAVEPGVYDAGLGVGARSEKVVLVTEKGPEVLSQFRWPLDHLT